LKIPIKKEERRSEKIKEKNSNFFSKELNKRKVKTKKKIKDKKLSNGSKGEPNKENLRFKEKMREKINEREIKKSKK
jgi:hypothetical protein